MSAAACTVSPAALAIRIRRVGLTVAAAGLAGGAAAVVVDPRLGLAGGAVVLGWTRLVGL